MTQKEQLKYVKNIAKQYAKRPQDADDIASIAIMKALKGDLKEPDALKSWLYMIVKRTTYNFYRSEKPMVTVEDVHLGECTIREYRMDFEKMTRRLQPRRKQCLRLYCQGYKWIDIADELGITRQNARTNAMLGVKTLQRWYGDKL